MAEDEGEDNDISEDGEDEDEEGGKKVGGKKKLIIILAVVLLLVGVGAGLFFGGVIGGGEEGEEEVAEEIEGEKKVGENGEMLDEEGNPIGPAFFELPEFLVNLSTTGKKVSFLKMKVTLELQSQDIVPKVTAMQPRVQDAVNTYLRELRPSDLAGSAGIYRLREELLLRINKAIEPEEVKDILFSEIIVQ